MDETWRTLDEWQIRAFVEPRRVVSAKEFDAINQAVTESGGVTDSEPPGVSRL